mmetsp:Transcript_6883/g.16880  ORF Transcript_6883/g.16880 Transcript_6883/m.16880 type:complete len:173 (+) Transcript_6883:104-622(+)
MIYSKAKRFYAILVCLQFYGTFCGAFKTELNKVCRHPRSAVKIQGFSSDAVVGQSPIPISLYSTPADDMGGARHSYVEGSTYDNRLAEIEAMGGDPFFLDDDHVSDVEIIEKETTSMREKLDPNMYSAQANKSSATDGNGPTPRQSKNIVEKSDSDWEWDGIVDEDAHLGLE